ncbi:MAG: CHAT domain-containing protein [Microcoleaceae cyanobacterium]
MSRFDCPSFSIAIARLSTSLNILEVNHFATWIVQSPDPSGYTHHDSVWPDELSQAWRAWLEMFAPHGLPHQLSKTSTVDSLNSLASGVDQKSYSSRLMQHFGMGLWQWLFQGAIQASFHRSQGIALGQEQPLRIRLDLREEDLIPLPWEIMQAQPGQPAISLGQQILFSRTTSEVNPLPSQFQLAQSLTILLVMGQPETNYSGNLEVGGGYDVLRTPKPLQLEQEAEQLRQVLEKGRSTDGTVPCQVTTLIQPTIAELLAQLKTQAYNVLFYAGHGVPAPDGGLLFLRPGVALNGTELAQVLVQCGVTLAVFNACWGAHPAIEPVPEMAPSLPRMFQAIPGSSLAKVLIHHGVPAVLGMRDAIADHEALSFIQAFAQALTERCPIDQAVLIARQQLLTLYKFNQPAWTLPVLYMHPEFNGQLVHPTEENRTELPVNSHTWLGHSLQRAWLRTPNGSTEITFPQSWPIAAGSVRVGRGDDNDVVIPEQWVSSKHAEIYCRNGQEAKPTYFLRDFSRYGTLVWEKPQEKIQEKTTWQRVHHQEISLESGTQLKFGSSQGQVLEFIIEIL